MAGRTYGVYAVFEDVGPQSVGDDFWVPFCGEIVLELSEIGKDQEGRTTDKKNVVAPPPRLRGKTFRVWEGRGDKEEGHPFQRKKIEGNSRRVNNPSPTLTNPQYIQASFQLTATRLAQTVRITYRQTERMQLWRVL